MLNLRSLREGDAEKIRNWPPYAGVHRQMDYALRAGGWLDTFADEANTFCYAAEAGGALIGFGLLIGVGGDAEMRLAMHPCRLGEGLGQRLAASLINIAFTEHGVTELQLIVRKNNPAARNLYRKFGFRHSGETTRLVMAEEVAFYAMTLSRGRFITQQRRSMS